MRLRMLSYSGARVITSCNCASGRRPFHGATSTSHWHPEGIRRGCRKDLKFQIKRAHSDEILRSAKFAALSMTRVGDGRRYIRRKRLFSPAEATYGWPVEASPKFTGRS